MAGLLGTLHSASTGMSVNQVAIQTTNQNIANMNNPGYTRERVEQVANRPYSNPGLTSSKLGAGQIGQGVKVSQITRIRNSFYDYQFRAENHKYGSLSVKNNYYSSMEGIFNEPSDFSISASINDLFGTCNELGKDPNSISAKNMFVEKSNYLSTTLNIAYKKMNTFSESVDKQINSIVDDVNETLKRLEEVERQITIIQATGKNPNDLMDTRDQLIDSLSSKIDITNPDVKKALADGVLELQEIANIDVSGELQGALEVSEKIQEYKQSLETLMTTIAEEFNDVYSNYPGAEDPKELFVITKDANGNVSINVNEDIKNNPSILVMNPDKANALFQIRDKKITIDGMDLTINNYYNSIVEDLGYSVQNTQKQLSNQSALMLNIDNARASESAVSMDEEMINLIQYQHAYSASAKVVSTIDSLLDVVINGLIR